MPVRLATFAIAASVCNNVSKTTLTPRIRAPRSPPVASDPIAFPIPPKIFFMPFHKPLAATPIPLPALVNPWVSAFNVFLLKVFKLLAKPLRFLDATDLSLISSLIFFKSKTLLLTSLFMLSANLLRSGRKAIACL